MDFERIKSLEGRYNRIRVSEEDIARIAKIMAKFAKNEDEEIDIRVESSDGKEVFRSHDPEFFLCDEMPREIRYISIAYSCFQTPTKCELTFDVSEYKPAILEVRGSGAEIPGIFSDLEKELVDKQIFGYRILNIADRFWFGLGLSALLAAAIYLIFDLWLDFWASMYPEFWGSDIHITLNVIGWTAIFLTIVTGIFWIEYATKKLISPIQFTGKISDPGARGRKVRLLMFTALLLPLIISFMPSVVFNLFNLLFGVSP
ncbi:MAG: hypothetical protein F4030_07175 [Gammaproteobacteria bacterium]|nr:hypothetical protein [Gammaproteobacteria bacterium]MYH86545.1 hypothetical protein [Gammaproteobacteria bacterium]MYK04759.1 hypothetical protein [Gammaproteobacteria bacterium]